MYISKDKLTNGYNEYIALNSPQGRLSLMEVGLLIMDDGETYTFEDPDKETAILLIEGNAVYKWGNNSMQARRINPFDCNGYCLHTPCGTKCTVISTEHSEFYIQKTSNNNNFNPKLYMPDDTHIQRAGANGELNGMMRRNIRTIFDYSIAPYSNMVLGEVINFPGCWSSYPPHYHPQPEVYFYRFDKPQGFGVGFTNGSLYEIHHNGLLLITEKSHPQAAAPGYALYYVWGIRHLNGDPWLKTRTDEPEHAWLLENPDIWQE